MLLKETTKVKIIGAWENDYFYEKEGKLRGIHVYWDRFNILRNSWGSQTELEIVVE